MTICIAVFSDVNECKNSPCSQQCENSPGSYRCLCNKGYSFNTDTGTCEGKVVNCLKTTLVATSACVTRGSHSTQTQAIVKIR